jgi:carbamoyltransferase
MTNILAINPGHNGSMAFVQNGKLTHYIEEERLSRSKRDGNPYRAMIHILEKFPVDHLVIGGTGQEEHRLPWTGEISYGALVRKYNPNVNITVMWDNHHLAHAASAFYNSGFDNAAAVIVDGSGSHHRVKVSEDENFPELEAYETESIYECSYTGGFNPIYKRYGSNSTIPFVEGLYDFNNGLTTVKAYEAVSDYLGFGFIEAGKTMGLAPYGEEDENIPPLFQKDSNRGNRNLFIPHYPAGGVIDEHSNRYLKRYENPKNWHNEPAKLTDAAKNLAYMIQKETQEYVGDLIERAVDSTGQTNIVISGGYGLNCVANYYFKERFPELKIFVDPVSHDGGTAIGMAKLLHWELIAQQYEGDIRVHGEFVKDPLKTLYLGPEYDNNITQAVLDTGLNDSIEKTEVTPEDVADLIIDGNIVAVWQGRSEAGPRALGNRSLVYDPTRVNGKDEVNKVKGREWFRPFAGTVMAEHADEWFDMRGLTESPFMMYAVNVKEGKEDKIPAITHVDDTCRIQTVTKEQNKHYYDLISAFDVKKGVPILFNTSFNLAGEPLVESLEDALNTLFHSDIKYLWLPEHNTMLKVETNYAKQTVETAEEVEDAA